MDERRILVTGSTGQVGTALRATIPAARFVDRSALDLADVDAIDPFLRALAPSAVINCAAYTAVDAAEDDEAVATAINGDAVGVMAATCGALGITFVTYSTDYVFDGTKREPYVESDPTCPINAYGRSKLRGEQLALNHPTSLVIRTSWVISSTHDNFVSTILRRLDTGDVRVVDDQVGRPTVAYDLARATVDLVAVGATGTAHVTNSGQATWYELATAVAQRMPRALSSVQPCPSSEFPATARRPLNSVLDSERSDARGLPPWSVHLDELVAEQMVRLSMA